MITSHWTFGQHTKSKHLKGRLGPRVSNVTFFNHGGRLGPRVSDVTFFSIKGGQLGPPVSEVTFFGSKEVNFFFVDP